MFLFSSLFLILSCGRNITTRVLCMLNKHSDTQLLSSYLAFASGDKVLLWSPCLKGRFSCLCFLSSRIPGVCNMTTRLSTERWFEWFWQCAPGFLKSGCPWDMEEYNFFQGHKTGVLDGSVWLDLCHLHLSFLSKWLVHFTGLVLLITKSMLPCTISRDTPGYRPCSSASTLRRGSKRSQVSCWAPRWWRSVQPLVGHHLPCTGPHCPTSTPLLDPSNSGLGQITFLHFSR